MKHLDWTMIWFVGTSLVHDYWIYWGLPQIFYWETKREYFNILNHDDKNKAA
ncbi:hypothetical protein [Virgibacillus ndiopensis]|uniref:hypothetical protein n=1 Tax=Virgibacillus ndiopensis TaxID=2004408 RepID=UPI00159BDC11|nr:hypothetical protein [Virgibacillus ndiopensis]